MKRKIIKKYKAFFSDRLILMLLWMQFITVVITGGWYQAVGVVMMFALAFPPLTILFDD